MIANAKKRELHPEIRKAGVHVHEVIKRLAACKPLNVTDSTGHSPEVVEQAIDLTQVFQQPQLLYFHLSATLSPSGAPEIARLVNYCSWLPPHRRSAGIRSFSSLTSSSGW